MLQPTALRGSKMNPMFSSPHFSMGLGDTAFELERNRHSRQVAIVSDLVDWASVSPGDMVSSGDQTSCKTCPHTDTHWPLF